MLLAIEHPIHPSKKQTTAKITHFLLPMISENDPYKGWKAVEVIKYEVVIQDAKFIAPNSLPIVVYIEAATVPSNPERNTFVSKDNSIQRKLSTSENI
ncbi:uncharacterized protein AC631_05870 [Debaryomyces fabryi]|uniref:Uncharacterized protein n=1 Tax=Debaryomyces fabryi TaxID=58627 RepID=A0A0V1PQ46_9ASCO|nr:uncharacterized protein AC631_05870 [Debaryomyces fabryi]KRZ98368.1 hypothetical protein AC631_05870 [Debaryomyces fabryi]